MTTPVALYLEGMRKRRRPAPSPRKMALGAGLSPSIVGKILRGDIKKPRTETLDALADNVEHC
jgi:hypothetical protein